MKKDHYEEPLTTIELEIINRSSKGQTNKVIGKDMVIGEEKLDKDCKLIFKKLKVKSMKHAIGNAFRLKLIE